MSIVATMSDAGRSATAGFTCLLMAAFFLPVSPNETGTDIARSVKAVNKANNLFFIRNLLYKTEGNHITLTDDFEMGNSWLVLRCRPNASGHFSAPRDN